MDKLTAAQRRFGMQLVVSNAAKADAPSKTEDHASCWAYQKGLELTLDRKAAEVLALQELLNQRDAEIDRLTQPTKWWLVLGWVLMAGTVIGVIAGAYEVIT